MAQRQACATMGVTCVPPAPAQATCVLPAAQWCEGDGGQGLLRAPQLAVGQMQSQVALPDWFWAGQRIPPLSTEVGMKTDGGAMRIPCGFPCPVRALHGYGSSGRRAEADEK